MAEKWMQEAFAHHKGALTKEAGGHLTVAWARKRKAALREKAKKGKLTATELRTLRRIIAYLNAHAANA